jgi:hypothetical protein
MKRTGSNISGWSPIDDDGTGKPVAYDTIKGALRYLDASIPPEFTSESCTGDISIDIVIPTSNVARIHEVWRRLDDELGAFAQAVEAPIFCSQPFYSGWHQTVGNPDQVFHVYNSLLNLCGRETTFINSFPGEAYRVLAPIAVAVDRAGDEYIAQFTEANIAMTGATSTEAVENLMADILDTYELYSRQVAALGPGPERQLQVLRRYIAECPRP